MIRLQVYPEAKQRTIDNILETDEICFAWETELALTAYYVAIYCRRKVIALLDVDVMETYELDKIFKICGKVTDLFIYD